MMIIVHDRRSARRTEHATTTVVHAKMTGPAMMIVGTRTAHARSTVMIAHVAMMMIVAAAMMVVAAVTDAPRPMSMSPVRYVTYMGILLVTAGGAMTMIAPSALTVVIMATKVQTLLMLMASTPTGIMTRGLLNISLVS
jgi:hypothetical protein